jgi:hypothetical protein
MMTVAKGATDVTTYFHLRLAADGTDATGLTITNFDLQYVRSGVAPAAKVDATALAATDSAHGDNQAIEIDATDQPGLYRVDWPDAAFATGVNDVYLTVKCATAFTETLHVRLGADAIADAIFVRDWTAITATVPARSALNALRFLRNKWTLAAGSLSVKKEDDSTEAWASTVTTDAAAEPIIGSDPA